MCVLFSVTHTLNGLATVLQILDTVNFDNSTKTTFTYLWHIIGIENLILGIALIVMGFQKDMAKVRFTAWFIMLIMFMRWVVITVTTVLQDGEALKNLVTESIAFIIVIALLFLGTRVRSKYSKE